MTPTIQIVLGSKDPHALMKFWAAALSYEIEDNTELIKKVSGAGLATEKEYFEADGKLWWNDLVAANDPAKAKPRLLLQRAPEDKTQRNRLHLDLKFGEGERAAEVDRLKTLGATVLYDIDEPGGRFTTMADPDGNEFCVS